MVNDMTGNIVLADCKNCGLDITKNDLETRIEAIGCIEYHIDELKEQIGALTEKKKVLTRELEAYKNGFCPDCSIEYKAQKLNDESLRLRNELKGFMETGTV